MAATDVTELAQLDLRQKADALSLRLYHLTNVAKLAAFACEARRVLEGHRFISQTRPDMGKVLAAAVGSGSNMWEEMPDVTGEVLAELARGMDALDSDMNEAMYGASRSADKGQQHG